MDAFEDCREWGVLVADDDAGRALSLASTLRAHGFDATEVVHSIAAIRPRLRKRRKEPAPPFAVLLLADELLRELDGAHTEALLELCEEAGAALVAVRHDDNPVSAEQLIEARRCGIADVVASDQPPGELVHRILLLGAMQGERNRLRHRETELEGELAELRVMESRLQHLVYHDELTGLWNRRRLKDVLELALLRADNLNRPCALLLIDMDRFKLVNDLEGYDAGDRFLLEVSRLLRRWAGHQDTVARIGSDEFSIVMENCPPERASERAEQIRAELEGYRFHHEGRAYRTCASIGLAHVAVGDPSLTSGEMMARADQACFVAKQHGRNRVHAYSDCDPELEYLRKDHRWAPRIRDAIEQNGFFFCYQPIVRVFDGRVTHFECLLRMRDAHGRVWMPSEFIPVAERTGLIHHIDMWVVDEALNLLGNLPAEQSEISVSINLSGHAFRNRDLFDLLARRLELSWVSPTRLVFEITETAAIENVEVSRELVARLRALGCRFALDDFGSGFSTFNYLKQFPVDFLKLDGSFIINLANDPMDQELVRHMISVARNLGKETIAEFVEDAETLEILRRLGVDYVQGHYPGRAQEQFVHTSPLTPGREGADGIARLFETEPEAAIAAPKTKAKRAPSKSRR